MTKIGIGVVTYNRRGHLEACLRKIRAHTRTDHVLLVADDGSDDTTREFCEAEGVRLVTGANRGVCWNKNRALFALEALGCDPILLVEDDCYPEQDGWDFEWRVATTLHGHVSYAHPKLQEWTLAGSGTALDPFVNNKATAQVSSISGALLRQVGFFDTRFRGYGVGHAEWTTRIKRAGRGFAFTTLANGARARANLYISGGITANDAPTYKDKDNIRRNEALFDSLKREPIYRHPWSDAAEQAAFAAEMAACGIKTDRYVSTFCGDAPAGSFRDVMYRRGTRKAVQAMLADSKGFASRDGWIDSVATGIPTFGSAIVPPFSHAALRLLEERARPEWRVFEQEAGYSTLWWAGRVAETHAVTGQADWAGLLRLVAGPRATIHHGANADALPSWIERLPGTFDVIVPGGPHGGMAALCGASRLSDGGVLVCNDVERADFAPARTDLKAQGFRELPLTGLAPTQLRLVTTTILYKKKNCLDI